MYLRRIPADEVDPERHRYVNRPGNTAYPFDIHELKQLADGRVRIEYGGTHVVCAPGFPVLVTDRDDQ